MARICETVTGSTMADVRGGRDRSTADLVELRLDGVADIDVQAALAGRQKPVIVTCRAAWEGGAFRGSEEERLRVLSEAVSLGAEFVDVEWRADRSGLPVNPRTQVVLSHHAFDGLPEDLEERVREMRREAAGGVMKIAVATHTLADCVTLKTLTTGGDRQVVIGMGAAGIVSRVCPWLFGSEWTYGGRAASGQMSIGELDALRIRQAGPQTSLYAIAGFPLGHSASPAMMNAAFAATDVHAVYVGMEARTPAEFLGAADAFGIAGASVTAPLKTGWAALGVRVDETARAIGAVNTLKRTPRGSWEGRNFDAVGFVAPLSRRGLQLTGQRVVVLGAGGAARAVAWVLKRQGAVVEIAARRPDAAAKLAGELGVTPVAWPPKPGWALLVNATPAGTMPHADASPLERESVRGDLVYDLVYNPADTRLLRLAGGAGAATIGGLDMLIAQAEAQFEYWTGRAAPGGVMERAAKNFLNRRLE